MILQVKYGMGTHQDTIGPVEFMKQLKAVGGTGRGDKWMEVLIVFAVLRCHLGLQPQPLLHEDQHPAAVPPDLSTEDFQDMRLLPPWNRGCVLTVHLLHGSLFMYADTILLEQYRGRREVS